MIKHYKKTKKKLVKKSHSIMRNILSKLILLFQKILNKIKYLRKLVNEIMYKELEVRPILKGLNTFYQISSIWILLALVINAIIGFGIIYFTNSFIFLINFSIICISSKIFQCLNNIV